MLYKRVYIKLYKITYKELPFFDFSFVILVKKYVNSYLEVNLRTYTFIFLEEKHANVHGLLHP